MLTKRQQDVYNLIIKGYTNKEIATELVITEHTVKAHKEKIYLEYQVHNSVQLLIKHYGLKE